MHVSRAEGPELFTPSYRAVFILPLRCIYQMNGACPPSCRALAGWWAPSLACSLRREPGSGFARQLILKLFFIAVTFLKSLNDFTKCKPTFHKAENRAAEKLTFQRYVVLTRQRHYKPGDLIEYDFMTFTFNTFRKMLLIHTFT